VGARILIHLRADRAGAAGACRGAARASHRGPEPAHDGGNRPRL